MDPLQRMAEARIQEAVDRGELDNLPGAGKPLPPDDMNPLVPEALRMAYRVLKNAGFIPPELSLEQEVRHLAQVFAATDDLHQGQRRRERLELLRLRLGEARRSRPVWLDDPIYIRRLRARLCGDA